MFVASSIKAVSGLLLRDISCLRKLFRARDDSLCIVPGQTGTDFRPSTIITN